MINEKLTESASKGRIIELLAFLREGLTSFHDTGSLCYTTQYAAQQLSVPLTSPRSPLRVLEVGAGTGSVTNSILDRLIPGDSFVTCEINSRFIPLLKSRLASHSASKNKNIEVSLFPGPVQNLNEDKPYDVIVCALPFLNFSTALVEEIFNKLLRLSTPDTIMSYYQYVGLHHIGKTLSLKQRRDRLSQLEKFFAEIHSTCYEGRTRVWRNFLPIDIFFIKIGNLVSQPIRATQSN